MTNLRKSISQKGFTVIEILIATTIFSVAFLLITYSIIQIGNNYYKGFNEIRTQDTARSILDRISQDIQFSNGDNILSTQNFISRPYYLCVGSNRYTILTGRQIKTSSDHALVKDIPGSGCNMNYASEAVAPTTAAAFSAALTTSGIGQDRELLRPGMRLAALTVVHPNNTDLYTIHIRLVFGDDDLLCSPSANSGAGDCNTSTNNFQGPTGYYALATGIPTDLTCKRRAGSQFCATSDLTTIVQNRIK